MSIFTEQRPSDLLQEHCLLDLIDEAEDVTDVLPSVCDKAQARICNAAGCILRACQSDNPEYDFDSFDDCYHDQAAGQQG